MSRRNKWSEGINENCLIENADCPHEANIFVSLWALKASCMTAHAEGFCSYASQHSLEQAYISRCSSDRSSPCSICHPFNQCSIKRKDAMLPLLQLRWMGKVNTDLTLPSIHLMSGEWWGTKLMILFLICFYLAVPDIEPRAFCVLHKPSLTSSSSQVYLLTGRVT